MTRDRKEQKKKHNEKNKEEVKRRKEIKEKGIGRKTVGKLTRKENSKGTKWRMGGRWTSERRKEKTGKSDVRTREDK